jgi:DNA-directed RNA polymerase subunit RPC12/RpoP
MYAKDLYWHGYSKQSEGEWIEHETVWGDVFYSCSVCKDERCGIDGSIWELGLNYCPNCGAKMKGGAE